MSKYDLKDCPFCGSLVVEVMQHVQKGSGHYWYGNCIPCDAEGPPADSADNAAKAWNERSTSHADTGKDHG